MVEQLTLFELQKPVGISDTLKSMAERNAVLIGKLRQTARVMISLSSCESTYGCPNVVTSDDLAVAEGIQSIPRLIGQGGRTVTYQNNCLGSVFRSEPFRAVGSVASRRDGRNGSRIRVWTDAAHFDAVREFIRNHETRIQA